jgi:hypothetical protein
MTLSLFELLIICIITSKCRMTDTKLSESLKTKNAFGYSKSPFTIDEKVKMIKAAKSHLVALYDLVLGGSSFVANKKLVARTTCKEKAIISMALTWKEPDCTRLVEKKTAILPSTELKRLSATRRNNKNEGKPILGKFVIKASRYKDM